MMGRTPYCQQFQTQFMKGQIRLNLDGKSRPFPIFVKNKYFKIMQRRATLALELPCIWTIYKLKNADLSFVLPSYPPPSPEMSLPHCNQHINIQPSRVGSRHILQTWPGQLKLCWKHFQTNGKRKVKIKIEKFHNQKKKKK